MTVRFEDIQSTNGPPIPSTRHRLCPGAMTAEVRVDGRAGLTQSCRLETAAIVPRESRRNCRRGAMRTFGGSSCAERGRHDCRRMPSQACGAATLGGAACKVSAARLQLRSSQRTLPVTDQRSMLSGRSDPQRAFCAATDQQRLSSASQSLQPANAAGD